MGWQPREDDEAGTVPGPGAPGPGVPSARDPRLATFASTDGYDRPLPSGRLALLADEVSGLERRCPGATDDELVGLLRAWAAVESWAAAGKLGVIRELVRRDGVPSPASDHGDLPEAWSQSLRYEVSQALACSTQSAETTVWLAWEQQARLPGIGNLLDDGTLTPAKARAVTETFKLLTDADAAKAEALIAGLLAGKTYTQVLRLAELAALTVDPDLAGRRREQAQKKNARVSCFREPAGTAALSGRDLPPDEALAAMASVNVRADEYLESGAFGATPMDVLRAQAYLDLLNGVAAADRIAAAEPQDEAAEAAESLAWAESRAARTAAARAAAAQAGAGNDPDDPDDPDDADDADDPDDRGTDGDGSPGGDDDGDGNDGGGNGVDGSGPGGSDPRVPPAGLARERRPADLIVPLATLLGLASRPGEIQGFGLLDPALARELAAAAAASPRTEICVTVTSPEGYAIGHGCARGYRSPEPQAVAAPPGIAAAGLPARLNLTIPAAVLADLAARADVTSRAGPWEFTPHLPRGSTAPPGSTISPDKGSSGEGFGTWALALACGRRLAVRLDLVPTFSCDHRYESHGYQPSGRLRHLVQVRDGTCTFPSCNRQARESDFEHAHPFDKGGKTCACNAGARSRACHQVKQSEGWTVTQPKPGWHRWQTPAGRVYTQEPKRYPA